MARTIGAGLSAHLAGRAHTRCAMLLIERDDGTREGFTDHDRDLAYDLGDGEVTYSAGSGIVPSDIVLSSGFDTDNLEVGLPIGPVLSLESALGGRYRRARAKVFVVNWDDLGDGHAALIGGHVAEGRIEGDMAYFQIRSIFDLFNQVIGRLITPYCDADFGDARCGVTPESITGTVTAASSPLSFTVSFSGSYADDYFNLGLATPLSGSLAGTRPREILDWTSGGVVTLFAPLADTPEVGDTFTITRGCSKIRKSDDASVPTCLSYDNVINFRGFPEVPGTDQALRISVPGE